MILEHVSCDCCGSNQYTVRYRKPDYWLWLELFEYPVVECADCGLVYVNPRPPYDRMERYYPSGYHDDRDTSEHRRRYEIQRDYLPSLDREKVLDIGCARGDWLHFLKDKYQNISAYGVDFYCESINFNDITFTRGDLPSCGLPAGYFDLITAWAVFEHLHSPDRYFSEVARIIKPGGRFIFLVTNADSLYGRMAYREDIPRHLYHFSPRTITTYASKHGFNVTRIKFDDRLWDGRGTGTFKHLFRRFAGVSWQQLRDQEFSVFSRSIMAFGKLLDLVLFSIHWEARLGRSGIMIVELERV